jgi:hypothetical protein
MKPPVAPQPCIIGRTAPQQLRDLRVEHTATAATLIELNDNQCRWIVSGNSAAVMMCGDQIESGSSYCLHHRLRSIKVEAAAR